MIASLGIILIAVLITLFELPKMIKKKLIKESVIFCILLSIGTCFPVLMSLGVQLPNPLDWIILFIKPLANMFGELLK
ncbi:MAG: hypothetical protein Q8935_09180 [Bacillota bacterium]|nr:hypothetical protein [Bacillota bacterium]